MMKQLIDATEQLVDCELEKASSIFGSYHNSPHEAAAVIYEERCEALRNVEAVEKSLKEFWEGVMGDDYELMEKSIETLEHEAMLAACEFIQVSAMAKKTLRGYARKGLTE